MVDISLHSPPAPRPGRDFVAVTMAWALCVVAAAAVVSQATWWGAILIGFVTNAQRHG